MTFKGHSRLAEMSRSAYDFLLPFHSNYGPLLYRFRHIVRYWSKIVKFIYSTSIKHPVGDDSVGISQRCLVMGKTRMMGLPDAE